MSTSLEAKKKEETRVSSDLRSWGLPLFASLCALAMLFEGTSLPLFEQYTGLGSGFMVTFVGAALLALACVLAWQVWSGVRFEPEGGEGIDESAAVSKTGLTIAGAGIALPIITIPLAGFPIGAGLAYACIARAYGSRSLLLDTIIGVVLASVTWFAFTKLGVQLGPFLPLGTS